MYRVGRFEWKGSKGGWYPSLGPLIVPYYDPPNENAPELMIRILSLTTNNNCGYQMTVEFKHGDDTMITGKSWDFTTSVIDGLGHSGYSSGGTSANTREFRLSFKVPDGGDVFKLMMDAYVKVLERCGVYMVSAPRIIEEIFHGDKQGQQLKPYGEHLIQARR